jgi:hypothetical protein
MLKFIPNRFNKKWFIYYLLTFIILYLILIIAGNGIFNKGSGGNFYLKMFYLAIVPSTLIFLFGFFGGKIIYMFSTLGVFIGTLFILNSSKTATGWEDLAAFAGFLVISSLSVGAGIAAETAVYIFKKSKNKG